MTRNIEKVKHFGSEFFFWNGKGEDSHPQSLTGGAETRQAEGRSKALVMFNVTPNCAAFLKASHRHSAWVFNTFFSPEQQFPSGFFTVASPLTYVRQSAMSRIMLEQSAAGTGAVAAMQTSAANKTAVRESRIGIVVLIAIVLGGGQLKR